MPLHGPSEKTSPVVARALTAPAAALTLLWYRAVTTPEGPCHPVPQQTRTGIVKPTL